MDNIDSMEILNIKVTEFNSVTFMKFIGEIFIVNNAAEEFTEKMEYFVEYAAEKKDEKVSQLSIGYIQGNYRCCTMLHV